MPRVVHFEIHADDPKRAVAFYEDVFDWEIQGWGESQDYWLVMTGPDDEPGINGGILQRQAGTSGDAVTAYVCTVDVPSVDEYVARATEAGGSVAVPKMPVSGVGWLAYCKDTEGNIFGLMEEDTDVASDAGPNP
jgi:predicted enzyme related to lactoylglutathione lyase